MKAKEFMDKNFVYTHKDEDVNEIAKTMENSRKFTCPVLNDDMELIGWITSFEISKGLRENKSKVHEIMSPSEDVITIFEDEPARLAVIETTNNQFVSVPVLNKKNQVVGIIRACDIVKLLSSLYDIKVYKLYEVMGEQLKGTTWEDLMEASAIVSKRTTGKKITAEEYENNIRNSTFGEAIWATGGLEHFFAGLISVGEMVIARKVGRSRR